MIFHSYVSHYQRVSGPLWFDASAASCFSKVMTFLQACESEPWMESMQKGLASTWQNLMSSVDVPWRFKDPWCCYIWCAMDPININPIYVSINIYQHHGSVMGSSIEDHRFFFLYDFSVDVLRYLGTNSLRIGRHGSFCSINNLLSIVFSSQLTST